jgi:hypothetical protein
MSVYIYRCFIGLFYKVFKARYHKVFWGVGVAQEDMFIVAVVSDLCNSAAIYANVK